MNGIAKKLFVVAFAVTVGAAGIALAHGGFDGPGYGGHMMGPGYGPHMMGPGYGSHMGGYGPHRGWWGDRDDFDLSREQAEKFEAARESFFRETGDLREGIYEKRAEIRSELAKENPDRSRLKDLQQDLSKLENEFDEKRLEYRIEVRNIVPGYENFRSRGYGPGAGYCWR